jgi:hypothetical protein
VLDFLREKGKAPVNAPPPTAPTSAVDRGFSVGREIVVDDLMQRGYRYRLSEPVGERFDPAFEPQLTPAEMLAMGVFGGRYMTDCRAEYPADWFSDARLCPERHDAELNFFGVNASQPLAVWRANGWIHPDDPRGWFQWYCRYYLGRRHPDDERQIRRWRQFRRHVAQVRANCPPHALECRPRQRQVLLHWAYDSRQI